MDLDMNPIYEAELNRWEITKSELEPHFTVIRWCDEQPEGPECACDVKYACNDPLEAQEALERLSIASAIEKANSVSGI